MKAGVYVATAPEEIKGIYTTWAACEAAVKGVRGAIFQKVATREEALAMLSGTGVLLQPGVYAFTDGNDSGGIGIVLVQRGVDGSTAKREVSIKTHTVLTAQPFLLDEASVSGSLLGLRNVLAEITACYHALTCVRSQTSLTLVFDYLGVGGWLQMTWLPPCDPVLRRIIQECHELIRSNKLTVSYVHQAGHRSNWAGKHEFAEFNAAADRLATAAGQT